MVDKDPLAPYRRTAALIAAAAVYELYPNVTLLGGGETEIGFFYHFSIPHPTHLHLIEEKMKQIIREKREIRILEMVPLSASELLKSRGLASRIEALGEDGLVQIAQIGSFFDVSDGPQLKNSAELTAFKIAFAKDVPSPELRIIGWCDRSKEDLKKFLKLWESYVEPEVIGERRGLWKGQIWLPEGLKMRSRLIERLKASWFQGALEVQGPLDADRGEMHRSLKSPRVAEIWQTGVRETHLQMSFFNQTEAEMISFLQSIGKTLTMLGFDHMEVSSGREIEYTVTDGLGRIRPLVHVKKGSKRGATTVDFWVSVVVERILFQILEKQLMIGELENQ